MAEDESGEDIPEGDGDEEAEGAEGTPKAPVFAPPDRERFRQIRFYKPQDAVPVGFDADLTRSLFARPFALFAARFDRPGLDRGVPLPEFEELVGYAGRLNRWVSNAAFSGAGYPNVLAALPGSLTVHFAAAEGEDMIRMAQERSYPNLYGARAVARLLAHGDDEETLLEAVSPLGKRAVSMLMKTAEESAGRNLSVEWYTREGEYGRLEPQAAVRSIEILGAVPPMVSRTEPFVGRIDEPSHDKLQVRIVPQKGQPFLASYAPSLESQIRDAWPRYVAGTLRVREPEHPSLPRAPKRERIVLSIEHVYDEPPPSE